MFTAIALMCAFDRANDCTPIVKGAFFPSYEECMADVLVAVEYADSQGRYIRDYKCISWGEPA